MAMNMAGSSGGGGRRGRRKAVMAEINVTPMVDVMLVLLIIFMVSAPLLTVGVPLDLPQTQAKSLDQDKNPLTLSVNLKGQVFLNETEIGLEELTDISGLSRAHLIRSFRKEYFITPHAFQTDIRIRQARRMLRSGMSPADTALNCGFADQAHFTRHFKARTGVTPAAFRNG